jgi:hypothetical protein
MEPPKVAVTELDAVTFTLQAAVPVHAPDQLEKVLLAAGVSLSVTAVFGAKFAVQVPVEGLAQLIPAGVLVTVPEPAPAVATVKGMPPAKTAVTLAGAVSVMLHVLPVQLPVQSANEKLVAGAAVKVTAVFVAKPAPQVGGQLIPAGLLVTVPIPVSATVSPGLKVPVTLAAALTLQVLEVPVQPVQAPKKYPVAGLAVSVTAVPAAKLAVQVPGQLIPVGALVIVPF